MMLVGNDFVIIVKVVVLGGVSGYIDMIEM